jgi:serine/threonine protein kinase
MRRLNKINKEYEGANTFVPELIDVICPDSDDRKEPRYTPDTSEDDDGNNNSGKTSKGYKDQINFGIYTPNVTSLSTICVVMEFIETDLDQILKHKIEFSEHHMLKIVYSALSSLAFIHEANIMHRDLKSANVLLNSDCSAKICDFGLSRSLPESCSTEKNLNT